MTLRSGALTLAFSAALVFGCGAPRTYLSRSGVYDELPASDEDTLRNARVFADSGRFARAHEILLPLVHENPRNLRLGTFLQEVELDILEGGDSIRGLDGARLQVPQEALHRIYAERVQEVPTSEGYVLAARLAPDSDTALSLLRRALELDPRNPWAHYGVAWAHAREKRFDEARAALEAVFEVDTGHLPSIRLDGSLLARAGDAKRAIGAFENWMARSFVDPSVDPRQRAAVRLDLAILLVEDGEPSEALRLLEAVEPSAPERVARVELVRATAFQALGKDDEARRAIRYAGEASEDELLVLVHEALLAAERGDSDAEREAWQQALVIAEREDPKNGPPKPADFHSLLVQLQALTRLARLGEPAP